MVATDKKIFLQSASDKPNRVRGMGYSSLWAYFGPKVQITQPFNHSTRYAPWRAYQWLLSNRALLCESAICTKKDNIQLLLARRPPDRISHRF